MKNISEYRDLKDASVFITGGGSGIGAAMTEAFLRQGSRVAFVQRSDASEFCNKMFNETNNRPLYFPCDVTNREEVFKNIKKVSNAHGPVSVLINNAANDQRHSLSEVTEDFLESSLAINFKSYIYTIQAVLPEMKKKSKGSIINITSISYMMGNSGYPVYSAANSALNGLTRSLARELGPHRIRINALAPGWVMTSKQLKRWASPKEVAKHLQRQCLPDVLQPEDIVGGALFLASDSSNAMTGQALVIDGGVVGTG
jgi:galactose dehydrogenase